MIIHLYGLTAEEYELVKPRIVRALKNVECHGTGTNMSDHSLIVFHKDVLVEGCHDQKPKKCLEIVDIDEEYLNSVVTQLYYQRIHIPGRFIVAYTPTFDSWGVSLEEFLGELDDDGEWPA